MGLKFRRNLLMILAIIMLFFIPLTASYGQSVNYYYDDLNRLIRVEYPDGTVVGYGYDPVGNQVEEALAPPTGTPVSVSGPITTATPTYTWDAVFGATMYCLKVNDSTGTQIDQCYTLAEVNCPQNTGTCSVTPSVVLAGGAGQWWIRIYNPAGYGSWSAAMDFSVNPPPAATLVSPNGSIATQQPTYTWNAVPGSTQYYLTVNDSSGVRIQQWYTDQQAGCPGGAGTCSATPSTQLVEGTGQWWIQTYNTAGNGPLSAEMDFAINLPPMDPYTKSLLHFNGANNGMSFIDEVGKTWTRVGNAVTKTDWKKFGTASGYFSGGNDRIYTPDNADFAFGTGNFTIDLWIKTTQSTQGHIIYQGNDGGTPSTVAFWIRMNGGKVDFTPDYRSYPSHHLIQSLANVNDGNPHHIAVVRNGDTFTLYVDGVSQNSVTLATFNMTDSSSDLSVGKMGASYYPYVGYVDELRISKGIARWTSNFTPPTAEYGPPPSNPNLQAATLLSPSGSIYSIQPTYSWNAVAASTWYYLRVNQSFANKISAWYSAADAGCPSGTGTCSATPSTMLGAGAGQWWIQTYNDDGNGPLSAEMDFTRNVPDDYTKSLLHFNGTNNGTSFIDEAGKTWTRVGNAVTKTDWKKFGTASGYFSGGNDRIYTPDNDDFAFGTGNFTIDLWIKTTQSTQGHIVYQGNDSGTASTVAFWIRMNGGKVDFTPDYRSYPSNHLIQSLANVNDGNPHHVAVVRNGDTFTLYVDGVSQNSVTLAGFNMTDSSNNLSVGKMGGTYYAYIGYVDELRISKGIARWTSNFTPPTAEYTQ